MALVHPTANAVHVRAAGTRRAATTVTVNTTKKRKANTITLELDPATSDQLDRIIAAVPLANRHAVARAGLRVGLTWLEDKPGKVVEALRGQKVHHADRDGGRS